MFTHAATPAAPTLATATQQATPSSPGRPSRLRGLSYLRNYTHSLHSSSSHSREDSASSPTTIAAWRQSITRATTYPAPGSPPASSIYPSFESPLSAQVNATQQEGMAAMGTSSRPGATGSAMAGLPATQAPPSIYHVGSVVRNSTDPLSSPQPASETAQVLMAEGAQSQAQNLAPTPPPPASDNVRPTIRFSQHQDSRPSRQSLVFSPMGRTLPTGKEVIKAGRYSERETAPNQPAIMSTAAPVGFKSKVVSRRHCEFWCENGQWYIRDVKSSSGTFLNHVRLSSPNTESKPFPIKDGDIVQLGIDFKGGEEMIFKCVKIRVEVNRGWQSGLNQFNVASHKALKEMRKASGADGNSSDCSICLSRVAPCQPLFVAPCSHTWHFKCVRPLIQTAIYPVFTCPNCRAVTDLEADVDEPTEGEWEELEAQAIEQSVAEAKRPANSGGGMLLDSTAPFESPEALPTLVMQSATNGDHAMPLPSSPHFVDLDSTSYSRLPAPSQNQQDNEGLSAPISISSRRSGESRRGMDKAVANANAREATGRTPSPTEQFPLVNVNDMVENPMTPRNDVGPFVFDGRSGPLDPLSIRSSRQLAGRHNGIADPYILGSGSTNGDSE